MFNIANFYIYTINTETRGWKLSVEDQIVNILYFVGHMILLLIESHHTIYKQRSVAVFHKSFYKDWPVNQIKWANSWSKLCNHPEKLSLLHFFFLFFSFPFFLLWLFIFFGGGVILQIRRVRLGELHELPRLSMEFWVISNPMRCSANIFSFEYFCITSKLQTSSYSSFFMRL